MTYIKYTFQNMIYRTVWVEILAFSEKEAKELLEKVIAADTYCNYILIAAD